MTEGTLRTPSTLLSNFAVALISAPIGLRTCSSKICDASGQFQMKIRHRPRSSNCTVLRRCSAEDSKLMYQEL